MNEKTKSLFTAVLLGLFLVGFSLSGILKTQNESSHSERRLLAQRPELTAVSVLSGRYFTDYETYLKDQFALRDTFRSFKALSQYYLFLRSDNNGLYIKDGSLSKIEYPLKRAAVEYAAGKTRDIIASYLSGTDCRVFFSLVPDKNYYFGEKYEYPHLDYDELLSIFLSIAPFDSYIDILDCLGPEDYYSTDSHWRQERLDRVTKKFAAEMGFSDYLFSGLTENRLYPFRGVYYGQAALPVKQETLVYLTNDVILSCVAFDYGAKTGIPVYREDGFYGRDPYDLFLSGASPIIEITNPNAARQKELILFRDSFGSSLAPLLLGAYSKITLVDTRYVSGTVLDRYIDFESQDVLFLYSSVVLNQYGIFK